MMTEPWPPPPQADFEPSALSITPDNCAAVTGPFYHGTKAKLHLIED